MKINRLNHTKSLFPHFYDKTDDSNFTKHLKVVGKSQYDIRHKLKTIEWSRILEKPLQIWKEQTESYVYDMHFKVVMPYLKEVNIYKNPIISADEEVISYEELCSSESFDYENRVKLYEKVLPNLQTPIYGYDDDNNPLRHRIPNDTFLLEVYTWDDYHFLKGFPENDYTVKDDNILQYRYNETFLSINVEEISYTKYLTFRVHKDKIKQIRIYKNDDVFMTLLFDLNLIGNSNSTDFSYTYFDYDYTNENTYLQSAFGSYFEIEDMEHNHVLVYFDDTSLDEYVFRLPLSDSDFDENGIVKDIYDLEVTTFEKRYRCRHEYDRIYSKRYCGYDEQLNDCFDHDYSLDMIGRLLNIHRFRFYQIYEMSDKYLSRTYPTYNNRSTEDDYHYMKRMQFYISNYNHIVFPVLEFWKYYHTMATIESRKRIIGEMDYAYLRTEFDDCIGDYEYIEEEFDSETVVEYSINKATIIEGVGGFVDLGDTWYESTIVKDVYVVPNVEYRLRYVAYDNGVDVTPRMICYNRGGVELRTTPIIVDSNKNSTEDSEYTEAIINIPEDTVSIKLVLESNSSFSFKNVTFERMTVVNFDNYYMGTETDYNPNVYDLYVVYEDLPSNLRIGGDRFDILFKRSLPLTKKGFFFMDVNEEETNSIEIDTGIELYYHNILGSNTRGGIDANSDYDLDVVDYIVGDNVYELAFTVESDDVETIYDSEEEYVPIVSDDELVLTTITYYGDEEVEEIMEHKLYVDTPTRVTHEFTTPMGTTHIHINISSNTNAELSNIRLGRLDEMTEEEVY